MNTTKSRFSPNIFLYNGRIAIALVPCIFVLGGIVGKIVISILMIGAMITYIMDMIRLKEVAFISIWITLLTANFTFIIQSVFNNEKTYLITLVKILTNGMLLALFGLWSTVQFQWIQLHYSALVLLIERLLLISTIPISLVVQTWGISHIIGLHLAPFFMMILGCILYHLCALPLPSSFQKQKKGPSIGGNISIIAQVQEKFDGFLSFISICTFPTILYLVTHWDIIFESEHFWSIGLLSSIPILYVCFIQNGLWWISIQNENIKNITRLTFIIIYGIVFIASFEGRIIFHSFGSYITLTWPWNWILVSLMLYINFAIFIAHLTGFLDNQTGFILGCVSLLIATIAGSIAVGVPLPIFPAPLLAAIGFALYYESRQLKEYFLFILGAIITVIWMIWQHFWFLDIKIGFVSIQSICQLISCVFVISLIIPGLIISEIQDHLTKFGLKSLLLLQAFMLTIIEERFYSGQHDEDADIYPAYLVIITSILGIFISRKLYALEYIDKFTSWLLQCVYISKLSMLILPDINLVLPTLALTLSITPSLLLLESKPGKLNYWKGLILVIFVISSVLFSRFEIFDLIQVLIVPRPSEGLLLGSLFLITSLGCLPILKNFYPTSHIAKRLIILFSSFGLLLVILTPPLPIEGGIKCPHNIPFDFCPRLWDERHVPHHETDDVEIYGLGLGRREHWPIWLLVFAVMTGLVAITSPVSIQKSINSRLIWGCIGGFCVGLYLGLEFFNNQLHLQFLLFTSTLLSCIFLVLLPQSTVAGPYLMPILAIFWASILPLSIFFEAEFPLPPLPEDMNRIFPDTPRQIEKERKISGYAAILTIYISQSLLLAFALKLKVSNVLKDNINSHIPGPSTRLHDSKNYLSHGYNYGYGHSNPYQFNTSFSRGLCQPISFSTILTTMVPAKILDRMAYAMKMNDTTGIVLRRLSNEGLVWVPTVGNFITLLCCLLCIILKSLIDGKEESIFIIATILLLLNQDPLIFRNLTEYRRYFPPVLALVLYLSYSISFEIIQVGVFHQWHLIDIETSRIGYLMTNFVAFVSTMPSIILYLLFLWNPNQKLNMTNLLFLFFNLLPFLLTNITNTKYLSLVGFFGLISHFINTQIKRKHGMRMI